MSDKERDPIICDSCGGALALAAGNVARLSSPGFVDFFKCDECGVVTTRDQRSAPDEQANSND